MENGGSPMNQWRFKGNEELTLASAVTIRGVLNMLMENLNVHETRPVIPLGHGDPSAFPSFRTTPFAEDAICAAVRTAKFNGYSSTVGIPPARSRDSVLKFISKLNRECASIGFLIVGALLLCLDWHGCPPLLVEARPLTPLASTFHVKRTSESHRILLLERKEREGLFMGGVRPISEDEGRAVAEYLSKDLPYKLSPDDVFLTIGCTQALEAITTVLARPGANILLPRPGFPYYEARAAFSHLEVRHFDLVPEKDWEVDLAAVEALSDENTVAMVIINPGNPCGNVFKYEHLKKVAETARKLGILVIADEVYDHLTFGSSPFVPMGAFGSIVPVVTVGSISKRWIVPGWRLGWLVTNDPDGILMKQGGAVPQILENTPSDFFLKIVNTLRESADICYNRSNEIPCITCPSKPEGSMFVMVKLNLSLLEGIKDDLDFCCKLAKEEAVIVLPGVAVGLKNWLRVTFAIEPSSLDDGLGRIKAFYHRHAKKQ
ncbi:hypothetical protein DH2020_011422 [Rehmannia glutinosa]|uniref:Aminotransferase class I/classII large domain-containing protein n=1 Tax=Rehmannia glutinosa TaxID=99300 RepID=A0ABR0XDD1_REHGL